MKTRIILLVMFFLPMIAIIGNAKADVNVGLSIGEEGIKSFYLAIGDHYRVPEKEVIIIKEKKIPDQELPIVFYLAKKTGTAPKMIIALRLEGKSWMDITFHFGLNSEIYYVPVKEVKGPPYGKALGHFKKKQKKNWNKIVLEDDDIINLVNLRFMSEYHGYSPDDIIKMRADGRNFLAINDEIKKAKKAKKPKPSKKPAKAEPESKGKKKK